LYHTACQAGRQLKEKGVTVVAVQASKVDDTALKEWVKKKQHPFSGRNGSKRRRKTRFAWGVQSLPWLILNG